MAGPRNRFSPRTGGAFPWIALAAVVGVGLVVALAAGAVGRSSGRDEVAELNLSAVEPASAVAASALTTDVVAVEVPDVTAMTLERARVLLEAAGLKVEVRDSDAAPVTDAAKRMISEQEPPAGAVVEQGSAVTLALPRLVKAAATSPESDAADWVVCIDPGHQARSDNGPEPVGPGSAETKAKVTGGATGVETGIPEYEIVLQISMNLKRRLEAKGVKVVMTRTTNDVNLSNSQRAAIANKAKADLFVRVHGDGSPDSATSGVTTLFPAANKWTRPFAGSSKRAARVVQARVVRATGAVDRGTKARSDLSGFNWSKVPCILVETGFLSNPVEDRLLSSPHYQDKIAQGMTDGIIAHLEAETAK